MMTTMTNDNNYNDNNNKVYARALRLLEYAKFIHSTDNADGATPTKEEAARSDDDLLLWMPFPLPGHTVLEP